MLRVVPRNPARARRCASSLSAAALLVSACGALFFSDPVPFGAAAGLALSLWWLGHTRSVWYDDSTVSGRGRRVAVARLAVVVAILITEMFIPNLNRPYRGIRLFSKPKRHGKRPGPD